jgi:hypothetical protein
MVDAVPATSRPHRGVLILIFGILGIVACFPLGIAAWVMGNSDLKAMQRGEMDRTGEGITQAGKICGIVGVCLTAIGIAIWLCITVLVVAGAAGAAAHH